ncbi:MAG: hypothetical protein HUK20_05195 [Fibrobacter sp.]|nr:hypothetical protein [Fibrobacter sp.]
MKKLLIALLFASAALWAEDRHPHNISASYGLVNVYFMSIVFGDAIENLFDQDKSETSHGLLSASSFNVAYGYDLTSLVELGGILTYGYIADGHDVHTISLMPKAKFNWINREHFRLYSQVAVGALFVIGDDQRKSEAHQIQRHVLPIPHVSLAGLEFGNNVSFFCELGAGQAGILAAGAKFRL